LVGKPEGKRSLESPGVGGRAVLKLILKNTIAGCGAQTGFIWLQTGSSGEIK